LLAEPAQELAAVGDLAARLGERLAHLERHDEGEILLALLHELPRAAQDLAASPRRRGGPVGLRRDRRVEGTRRVGRSRVGDARDHLVRRRVAHGEVGSALRARPLAADEELRRNRPERLPLDVVHGRLSLAQLRGSASALGMKVRASCSEPRATSATSAPTSTKRAPASAYARAASGSNALTPAGAPARAMPSKARRTAATTSGCVCCPMSPIDAARSAGPTKTPSMPRVAAISCAASTASAVSTCTKAATWRSASAR